MRDEDGKLWVFPGVGASAATEDEAAAASSADYAHPSGDESSNRVGDRHEGVAAALDRLSERVGKIEELLKDVPDEVFSLAYQLMRDERDELLHQNRTLQTHLDIAQSDHSMKLAELTAAVARQSPRRSYGGGLVDDVLQVVSATKRLRAYMQKVPSQALRALENAKHRACRVMRLK